MNQGFEKRGNHTQNVKAWRDQTAVDGLPFKDIVI